MTLKTAFENFYVSDFSVGIASITIKFLVNALYNILKGSMSQNFDLGPAAG